MFEMVFLKIPNVPIRTVFAEQVTFVVREYANYVVTKHHYYKECHSSNSKFISSTHDGGH